MLVESYDLEIERCETSWQTTYFGWTKASCARVFWFFTGLCGVMTVIGFVLTFTICPKEMRIAGVLSSFAPIFLWCIIVAISLSGMQTGNEASPRCAWCSNCIWKCFFTIAFAGKVNKQYLLENSSESKNLYVLLDSLSDEQIRNDAENVFDVPNQLSLAKKLSANRKIYNDKLWHYLPSVLHDLNFPKQLDRVFFDYLI